MNDTVGNVLLTRLRARGVEQVFAYPGDGINRLPAAWRRADDAQLLPGRGTDSDA